MNRIVLHNLFRLVILMFCTLTVCVQAAAQDISRKLDDARKARMEGRAGQAVEIYTGVVELNPENTDALVGRGFAYLQVPGRLNLALRDFNRAIRLAPDYVDAYIGKAIVAKRQGEKDKAQQILLDAERQLAGDREALKYLSTTAWREGFYQQARRLDDLYTPDDGRKLVPFRNEVAFSYGIDAVDQRDDWWDMNFTYVHQFKPDTTLSIYYSELDRSNDSDFYLGGGYSYRLTHDLSLAYNVYVSDESGFTAIQRHRPRVFVGLPYAFTLGVGGNFDEFSSGWASVSYSEITKYFGGYYAKYAILAGKDSFDETVVTHIGEVGYRMNDELSVRLGYANGNESVGRLDSTADSSVEIESLYLAGKYAFKPQWGLSLGVANEWRDREYFRTSVSSGVFYKFE